MLCQCKTVLHKQPIKTHYFTNSFYLLKLNNYNNKKIVTPSPMMCIIFPPASAYPTVFPLHPTTTTPPI